MKTNRPTLVCTLVLLPALALSPGVFAQGSLTPSGAPAPMMKTLNQIEPRTVITNLPWTASAPGGYVVDRNLSLASGNGISVTASDVTIDLNGFVLTGAGGSGHGIHVAAGLENVAIRNGVLREWGNDGIHALEVKHLHVESVTVRNCLGDGLEFSSGTVGGSHFHNNLGAGINSSKPVPGIGIVIKKQPGSSSERNNGGGGIVLEGDMDVEISTVIHGNTGHGISWSPATPADGLRLKLNDCDSSANTGDGLHIAGASSNLVLCDMAGVTFSQNGGAGIFAARPGNPIKGLMIKGGKNPGGDVSRNGAGGIVLEGDCDLEFSGVIFGNTGNGISWSPAAPADGFRLKLDACDSSGNTGHGLHIAGASSSPVLCEMAGVTFSQNGGAGIFSSKPIPGIGIVVKKNPGSSSARNNGAGGIVLEGDCDVEFSGLISGNTGHGISWSPLNPGENLHLTLEDTVIQKNTGNGIGGGGALVAGDATLRLARCRIAENQQAGIDLDATAAGSEAHLVVTDSAIEKNSGTGARVKNGTVFRPSTGTWRSTHISDNGGAGLLMEGVAVHIEDSVVRGNGGAGCKLDGKKHVKTGHVTLLKRTIFVNNGGDGVHIASAEDDAACRVIVQDSQFNGNTGSGLHLATTHPGSLASLSWLDSHATANVVHGVFVSGAVGTAKGSVTLRGGDCQDNGANAITIAHPEIDAGIITGMLVARSGGAGILSSGQSLIISGNTVSHNTAAGIRIEGDDHYLSDNRCLHNAVGIELAGNNNALAQNVYRGAGAPFIDLTGANPSAPLQNVAVGVNPLGNIEY